MPLSITATMENDMSTHTNVDIDELNTILLEKLNGTAHTFDSFDHVDVNDNALGREEMTAEYLRSITVSSLPLGALQLRIGAPLKAKMHLLPTE